MNDHRHGVLFFHIDTPWTVDLEDTRKIDDMSCVPVKDAHDNLILFVPVHMKGEPDIMQQQVAYAQLAAMMPDMLEALVEMWEWINQSTGTEQRGFPKYAQWEDLINQLPEKE